jgi:hypothetical protein
LQAPKRSVFKQPVIRGGAVRDGLRSAEINDYDLYVSRAQVADGLRLPSIQTPHAPHFYKEWLS